MENEKSEKNQIQPHSTDSSELSEPDFIRSEVNLLVFPFFALTTKGLCRRFKIEFRAVVNKDGEYVEILWKVAANPEYGYPGLFDRQVHRAVEQIIIEELQRKGRVENPIPIGSLYSLCERLGLEKRPGHQEYGGREYRAIKRALERIATTAIKSEGTFYHKGERRWVSQVFHLYDAVVFQGKRLRDGTVADTNYVYLSDLYLESLNALYVKPLDYQYQRSLRSHIASRLYEILGVKFYGLRQRCGAEVWFRYSTLTQLLPVERCQYFSDAKKQLNPAHEELVATGFLASYEWREAKEAGDWIITYRPGWRAREEIRRALADWQRTGGQASLPGFEEEIDYQALPEKVAPALSEEQEALVAELVRWRVSEATARELVVQAEAEVIRRWLEAIAHSRARDKAAFLVRAIREGWEVSEAYLEAQEEKKRAAKARQVEQARLEQQRKERARQEREAQELDRLYFELSDEDRGEVDRLVQARLPQAIRERLAERGEENLSPGSAAILRATRREVLKEWLGIGG
jgi:hypothetical protein